MPDNRLILFGNRAPDVYKLTDIYDPDKHGTDPAAAGKHVPAIGSVVIDDTLGGMNYTAYVVHFVDATTLKSTLVPLKLIVTDELEQTRVVGYGNEMYMLYYDDRVSPTRLIVDDKLVLFGNSAAEYRLIRNRESENKTILAYHLDEMGNNVGDRIPIVESTAYEGIRKGVPSFTDYDMTDGEVITMEVYDSGGVLIALIKLVAKRALILNDFESAANPVVEFTANANQLKGSDWLIYVGQNPSNLTIWPELVFGDGTRMMVPVDNNSCFMYGMDDVKSDHPGMVYNLLLKYFLADNIPSPIAEGDGTRFLTFEKRVVIDSQFHNRITKLMATPIWSPVNSRWDLYWFAYFQSRDAFEVIPNNEIEYVGTPFSGTNVGLRQDLTVTNTRMSSEGMELLHEQSISIEVRHPTADTPWLIADTPESIFVYGNNMPPHVRPVLHYSVAEQMYFVPTSKFPTKAQFLDNFWYNATPPYLAEIETESPLPTHFVLREIPTGRLLTLSPVAINTFDAHFNLITDTPSPDQYVNSTIMMEFTNNESGPHKLLYGVPVEVKPY